MNNELTAALATIEKCREITGCPAGVDLHDHLRQLVAENVALKQFPTQIVKFIEKLGSSEIGHDTREKIELAAMRVNTTATDGIIAKLISQGVDVAADQLATVDTIAATGVMAHILRKLATEMRERAK